jgi:ribonuclease P protein component
MKRTCTMDVFFSSSPASRSRLGLVVPKHRRSIVERNRLKRRIREVGRTEVLPRLVKAGIELDVLIRARREAYEAGFGVLKEELAEMTEELCSRE